MTVLFAYDASDCSKVALADLVRAGIPSGSRVRIISVSEWFPLPAPEADLVTIPTGISVATPNDFASEEEGAKVHADVAAAELAELRPDLTIESVGRAGSPAQRVVEEAEEIGADLIVVGSHGRGALGRLFLGSVSQQILHGASVSVRIARGDLERSGPPSFLFAVDGSEYTPRTLDAILEREWPEGTTALVATAADYSYDLSEETAGLERIGRLHEQIVARLAEVGVTAVSHIDTEEVSPTRALQHLAESTGVEMLFVGARGLTGFERFMLGSVSSAIAMRAPCTVEVVR